MPLYRRSIYRCPCLQALLKMVIYQYLNIFYGRTSIYRRSFVNQWSTSNKLLCTCEEKYILRNSTQSSIISQYRWGRVFPRRGRVPHLTQKIDYRNPGEGFILKFFKWENPGEEKKGEGFSNYYTSNKCPES